MIIKIYLQEGEVLRGRCIVGERNTLRDSNSVMERRYTDSHSVVYWGGLHEEIDSVGSGDIYEEVLVTW